MELGRPLATVTPTVDGDVLAVLARQDVTFTTGKLHRILARYSEEGIRKVLQRLTKQGVVDSERVGNAFTYRLNRDHIAAEHIIGLAHLAESLLNRLQTRLQAWEIPPTYAAVFGSTARGSMTVDSDLDIMLIRPDNTQDDLWDSQVENLAADVTRWTGNDARILQFAADELLAHGSRESVLRDILREGLTVIGERSWLQRQLRKPRG